LSEQTRVVVCFTSDCVTVVVKVIDGDDCDSSGGGGEERDHMSGMASHERNTWSWSFLKWWYFQNMLLKCNVGLVAGKHVFKNS